MNTVIVLLVGIALGAVAAAFALRTRRQEPAEEAEEPRTLAVVAWDEGIVYVAADHVERVAVALSVRDAAEPEWSIRGLEGEQRRCFVAYVSEPALLADVAVGSRYHKVRDRMRCGSSRPPGSDDTACIRQPGNVGRWYKRVQTVGYSQCVRGGPTDTCVEARVQVGDWIYYSDQCRTETRRIPYMKNVCLP